MKAKTMLVLVTFLALRALLKIRRSLKLNAILRWKDHQDYVLLQASRKCPVVNRRNPCDGQGMTVPAGDYIVLPAWTLTTTGH